MAVGRPACVAAARARSEGRLLLHRQSSCGRATLPAKSVALSLMVYDAGASAGTVNESVPWGTWLVVVKTVFDPLITVSVTFEIFDSVNETAELARLRALVVVKARVGRVFR